MATISIALLREWRACKEQVAVVEGEWGSGEIPVTEGALLRAGQLGLDLDWFARRILAGPAWTAYWKANVAAWAAYREAIAPAWAAYVEANRSARGIDPAILNRFCSITTWAPAEKIYGEAVEAARRVRTDAIARAIATELTELKGEE